MEQEKLNKILKLHKDWSAGTGGGERADLSGADLSGAYLCGAYLSCANLSCANLSGADGILSPISFIAKNFEAMSEGIIAYKSFGDLRKSPDKWEIKAAIAERKRQQWNTYQRDYRARNRDMINAKQREYRRRKKLEKASEANDS